MPRPPLLPIIDWPAVFHGGIEWQHWLDQAEFPDKREAMATAVASLAVPATALETLRAISRPVHVVAIAEDWCGDVVRHAPVMQAIAQVQPLVRLRFIARHDHPDLFARFLTNGGEAIPKFVFLSESFVETGNWGPMSAACRRWIAMGKACNDVAAARRRVSANYEADPGRVEAFNELADLAALAATVAIDG